ncbi:MAG TPA: thiosulfate oxidation carrier protein SoxY [Sedimenticola sp.]|nr:thiosulfate oxidation carrier protein SoxY [Sedimenticola sp.]
MNNTGTGADLRRRLILKGAMAAGAMMTVLAAGLAPARALAAWPKKAFRASGVPEALKALTGSDVIVAAKDAVRIEGPDVAENGKARIKVFSDLADMESIAILIPGNPAPLAASFKLSPEITGHVATRIRMEATGEVLAVVKAGGRLFSAKKRIIVPPRLSR